MISVEQALDIVKNASKTTLNSETVNINNALNFVLASDIFSPISMPPFRQSAMDGYALNLHDDLKYYVKGEIKTGDNLNTHLKPGEAVRIFTGAPVPDSANAIIMQEKTTVKNAILVLSEPIKPNANIRPLGEQVFKDDLALKKGAKLVPAAIAYLTSLGITEVTIYKKPTVAIVVTGNELAEAGKPLRYGQIYESNAIMLKSALEKADYKDVTISKVEDNYNSTLLLLSEVINKSDVVLISGGISVGDYDFVGKALNEIGVNELFYKVKQKPGKPLFFGKKDEKLIFALPGNPAAALSCFYIYVLTALEYFRGNTNFSLPRVQAQSNSNFVKKGDRAQFLKAIYYNGKVTILEGQNSSMLHTFALANALVYLHKDLLHIKKGDLVETILLPIQ
ncbi:molybdopterin molybdotransferase MoeA [Hanstruepera marina]|uniref:molybdopterin molybdotransferase MoeA n=1 Tax=Hanstruepera marina TaxID=2873265 RepID=UPI001CA74206|nr:gephyrin-like molybdotransferase Glp [Hanstruepera marina]